jgi:hypothetical protein
VGQGCDGEDDYIRICQECIGKRKEVSRLARLKAEVKPGDVVELEGNGIREVIAIPDYAGRIMEGGFRVEMGGASDRKGEFTSHFDWQDITRHWPAKKE